MPAGDGDLTQYHGLAKGLGAALVPLGLMIGLAYQQMRSIVGEKPDWITPFLRAGAFLVLLGFYALFASNIRSVVTTFGSIEKESQKIEGNFQISMELFRDKRNQMSSEDESKSWIDSITSTSVFNVLFEFFVYLTYLAVLAVLLVLKNVQHVMLQVAYMWGPICIGFASIHPFFHRLMTSWFWAYVEIAAWGISMKFVVLAMLGVNKHFADKMAQQAVDGVSLTFADQAVLNIFYILLLLSVPAITSMFIRSQSAAGIAAKPLGAATAAMSMVGAKAGASAMSVGGGAGKGSALAAGGAASVGYKAAKMLVGKISGRKGDK